jgi:hypothetical protein
VAADPAGVGYSESGCCIVIVHAGPRRAAEQKRKNKWTSWNTQVSG